ncbi:DUF1294 domain-containing protein [Allopontixanthobacter confluentis]
MQMHFLTHANIATFLIAMNFIAFAAFGIDKMLAEAGPRGSVRRISEATLLQLAFLGGIFGAFAGRHLFRHKTRKQPFFTRLYVVAVVQVMGLGMVAGWFYLHQG